MPRNLILVAVITCSFLSGCANVAADRTLTVANAGRDYVQNIKKVNDLALDISIDFTADILPALPRTEQTLNDYSDELKIRVHYVGDAHDYIDGIASYFSELQALSNGDQSEATVNALAKIADSLKVEPVNLKLSDERKVALTGLAGYVAKQVHAKAVEKALIRDSTTVAQALALSEQMLDEQIRWLNLREKAERLKKRKLAVYKPFIENASLGSEWKNAWKEDIRGPKIEALLVEAKQSSQEMQKLWVNILRGQYSVTELRASLDNVKAGIDAITLLLQSK